MTSENKELKDKENKGAEDEEWDELYDESGECLKELEKVIDFLLFIVAIWFGGSGVWAEMEGFWKQKQGCVYYYYIRNPSFLVIEVGPLILRSKES